MARRGAAVAGVFHVFLAGAVVSGAMAADSVYPGKTWATKSPAEMGMDPAGLGAFSRFAGGRGCVVRHGYLVYTWGDYKRRGDVASACKPWYSHFLFKAVEDGKVTGLDAKAVQWAPRLGTINAALDHKDAGITLRHMANQISCYGVTEKPGTAFCYNDWQMALFWDILFCKIYGATYQTVDAKVLRPMLTEPLGCEDKPTFMVFGTRNRPGRVGVSPRDFCRFGLLYLRKGKWRGKQLISAAHAVQAVTSPLPNTIGRAGMTKAEMIPGQRTLGSARLPDNQGHHEGGYSFLWWVNGKNAAGRRLWPGLPKGVYGAFGHGGPRAMAVIPSLDLVVSWNDAKLRGWGKVGQALERLVGSVNTPTTAPASRRGAP